VRLLAAGAGCSSLPELSVFEDTNFEGWELRLSAEPGHGFDLRDTKYNDAISSIKVYSGVWRFFEDSDFKKPLGDIPPSAFANLPWPNDRISSFLCVSCS
jgi:hypothetical protein